jgi:hypothetical protein
MSTRSRRFSRLSSGPPWPTGDSLVCSFEERPIGPRPIPRNILGDTVRLAAPTEEGAHEPGRTKTDTSEHPQRYRSVGSANRGGCGATLPYCRTAPSSARGLLARAGAVPRAALEAGLARGAALVARVGLPAAAAPAAGQGAARKAALARPPFLGAGNPPGGARVVVPAGASAALGPGLARGAGAAAPREEGAPAVVTLGRAAAVVVRAAGTVAGARAATLAAPAATGAARARRGACALVTAPVGGAAPPRRPTFSAARPCARPSVEEVSTVVAARGVARGRPASARAARGSDREPCDHQRDSCLRHLRELHRVTCRATLPRGRSRVALGPGMRGSGSPSSRGPRQRRGFLRHAGRVPTRCHDEHGERPQRHGVAAQHAKVPDPPPPRRGPRSRLRRPVPPGRPSARRPPFVRSVALSPG